MLYINGIKEEIVCHPEEEVQVQEVHAAEAVRVAGAAVHQEDVAVHLTAVPTEVLAEAAAEVYQPILPREHGEISLPVCPHILEQSQLF